MSLSRLHHAIKARESDRCLEIAGEMPHVPLRYVARIVYLLAEARDPRYDRAARRFLLRAIEELDDVPLVELKKLADILAHTQHYYWGPYARMALHDVVGQLHRRNERLRIEFDTVGESKGRRR